MKQHDELPTIEIQQRIVAEFLNKLEQDGVSPDITSSIQKTLVNEGLTEINLRKAIFPNDTAL